MTGMSEPLRRVTAAFLLLTGAAAWAYSTWATAGVVAAEWETMWVDPRHNESNGPGHGQLATALFDVQVGALLVFGCAVAALLCRSVRRPGEVLAILFALPCVLFAVNAVLARVVGSSLTGAVMGGLVLVGVCIAFALVASRVLMQSPQQLPEPLAGRLLLLALALTAAGAVLVLEGLEPANWIVEVLPGLVSMSVVQGALIVAMVGLVAIMAPRLTAAVVGAAVVIALVGGWLVLAPVSTYGSDSSIYSDGSLLPAGLGAVLVTAAATAAVSGHPGARPKARLLAVAATTAAFCVALYPSILGGVSVGIMVQSIAGGELGADGLPLLMGGVFAGMAGLAGFAAVLMRPNQPSLGAPAAAEETGRPQGALP